jgi:hypothetical protein
MNFVKKANKERRKPALIAGFFMPLACAARSIHHCYLPLKKNLGHITT